MPSIDWRIYAGFSALFAALTAVFGKLGVSAIPSDLATFLRTIVVLLISALFVSARAEWQNPANLSPKGIVFLILNESPPSTAPPSQAPRLREARISAGKAAA